MVDFTVSSSQSFFIKGENILENVIISHELVKGYSRKRVSPGCTIKDIRKAYDSVEWHFLRMVLLEFDFPTQLIKLIMECVDIVQYTLLINEGILTIFSGQERIETREFYVPLSFCHSYGIPPQNIASFNTWALIQLSP